MYENVVCMCAASININIGGDQLALRAFFVCVCVLYIVVLKVPILVMPIVPIVYSTVLYYTVNH